MASTATALSLSPLFPSRNPRKTLVNSVPKLLLPRFSRRPLPNRPLVSRILQSSGRGCGCLGRLRSVPVNNLSAPTSEVGDYQFSDGKGEIELRVNLPSRTIDNSSDIFVDVDDLSLRVRVRTPASVATLLQASQLYDRIKPSETIWYIDEDQLVVSLKKMETELKWPDLVENWVSLTTGVSELLKGTSLFLVGDSTVINQMVAKELASGIRYIPFITSEVLEEFAEQPFDSWVNAEGEDFVAEVEGAVIENAVSNVRLVVATLGGGHGVAGRSDKWRHLYSGITIWLSLSEAADEASAREEARKNIQEDGLAYSNAELVIKLGGWDPDSAQIVAQACLSAIKKLLLSDKQLIGKKSLYLRSGCRSDWPDIMPPGQEIETSVADTE